MLLNLFFFFQSLQKMVGLWRAETTQLHYVSPFNGAMFINESQHHLLLLNRIKARLVDISGIPGTVYSGNNGENFSILQLFYYETKALSYVAVITRRLGLICLSIHRHTALETRCTHLPALQIACALDILGGYPVVNSGAD